MPETSEKPASIGPPPATSPNSTLKLNAPYGLSRFVGIAPSPHSAAGVGGPLPDAENHELGRLDGRHADQADQPAIVEIVLRHRAAVAEDEVRLVGSLAEQRSVAPLNLEEVLDGPGDVAPQRLVVGLEYDPLSRFIDGVLEIDEQPPHVDVEPFRIRAHRARAPDAVSPVREEAQRVDVLGVEHLVTA